jgi:hypothetical protein
VLKHPDLPRIALRALDARRITMEQFATTLLLSEMASAVGAPIPSFQPVPLLEADRLTPKALELFKLADAKLERLRADLLKLPESERRDFAYTIPPSLNKLPPVYYALNEVFHGWGQDLGEQVYLPSFGILRAALRASTGDDARTLRPHLGGA